MGRARNGEAIRRERLTPAELRRLPELLAETKATKDLATWRRGHCVVWSIEGKAVLSMAGALDIDHSAVTKWLAWYGAEGADGLRTTPLPGRVPRLTQEQRDEVARVVEAGPVAAGF